MNKRTSLLDSTIIVIAYKKNACCTRGNSRTERSREADVRRSGNTTPRPKCDRRYRFTVFLTWPRAVTTRFPVAAAILSNGSRRGVSDPERERERAGSISRSRKTRNSLHHTEQRYRFVRVCVRCDVKKKEVGHGLLTFDDTALQVYAGVTGYSLRRSVCHLLSRSVQESLSVFVIGNSCDFLSIEVVQRFIQCTDALPNLLQCKNCNYDKQFAGNSCEHFLGVLLYTFYNKPLFKL